MIYEGNYPIILLVVSLQALASSHVIIWFKLNADLIFATAEKFIDVAKAVSGLEIIFLFDMVATFRNCNKKIQLFF